MTPTQRSLALLRKEGWTAAIVEKWNGHARIRQDLFGFADLLAVKITHYGVLAIQTTTGSNASVRRKKIAKCGAAHLMLACANSIELWTWSKKGKRGKRKVWTVKRERALLIPGGGMSWQLVD